MEPKTAIVVGSKKPRGRVPGVSVPASPATIAANRARAWKHGKYARSVTAIEGRAAMLSAVSPDVVALTEDYMEALDSGDLASPNAVAAMSLAEREVRRREMADEIARGGVMLHEMIIDKDGKQVGFRLKANPLIELEAESAKILGHTAADMQLTRKSRGEGDKDAATAAFLRRDKELRERPKDAMPPPPD